MVVLAVYQDLKCEPSWKQWSHFTKKFTFTIKSLKTKIICSTPRLQLLMMYFYFVLHSEWSALCRRPEWRNIGQFWMMYRQAIFLQMSVLVFAMVCNGAHLICKNQIVGRNFRIGAHLISSTWFLMPIARNDVLRKNYYIHRMILTMSKCPRKHQRSLDQRRRVPQWRSVTQTEAACLVLTLVLLSLLSGDQRLWNQNIPNMIQREDTSEKAPSIWFLEGLSRSSLLLALL